MEVGGRRENDLPQLAYNKSMLYVTVLVALITLVTGIFTSKITADATINDKIAEVNTATAVVAKTVDLNDKSTTARLDRLENKIDWLIQRQGGVPSLIANTLSK